MPENYQDTIVALRKAFVEACRSVFGETLVAIITKGSSVKGGFIPGLSDVDLHVYLTADAFSHSDFLKLELGLRMQEKMADLIRRYDFGGGPIQMILINVSQLPDWSGPVPESYILLYGDRCPSPPPQKESMLKQDLDGLKSPTYADKLISSFVDKDNDELANYVRRLNTAVTPTLYRVLSLLTQDPLRVWKMTKFAVLDELANSSAEGAKQLSESGREFYKLARQKAMLEQQPDLCRETIRVGYRVVNAGRKIGQELT